MTVHLLNASVMLHRGQYELLDIHIEQFITAVKHCVWLRTCVRSVLERLTLEKPVFKMEIHSL